MIVRPRSLALCAITFYQRFVSPYKGFCCAYGFHTGHASCSRLGYRAIRMRGIGVGTAILRRRLKRCSAAYRQGGDGILGTRRQQGFCDIDCGFFDLPCDAPLFGCHDALQSLECWTCLPCDCDWPDWPSRRRRDAEPAYVYIPPGRPFGETRDAHR